MTGSDAAGDIAGNLTKGGLQAGVNAYTGSGFRGKKGKGFLDDVSGFFGGSVRHGGLLVSSTRSLTLGPTLKPTTIPTITMTLARPCGFSLSSKYDTETLHYCYGIKTVPKHHNLESPFVGDFDLLAFQSYLLLLIRICSNNIILL